MREALTIFALWVAGLGAAAQFGKFSIAWDMLRAEYDGLSPVLAGLMLSVVGMVGLVFGTTAGLLVARVGERRAVVLALLAGAAVSLAQSFLPPFPVMLATRMIEGASHLAIVVVGPVAIAAAAAPRWQGAAMTLWSSFFGLTYAVLAWAGPGILSADGVQGLFRLHALWMLVMSLVLWALMPKGRTITASVGAGLWAAHRTIYASPFLAAPALGFVCYTITYVAVLTLLPGAMGGQGAFVAVAMPLVSIAVSLTLGVWLLSRMPAFRLVQAGFGVAMVSTLALWLFWGSEGAAVAAALALGAALGVVQGASFASIPQINPTPGDRARAAGAIAQLGNLGTTTGTPILAYLMEKAGVSGLALFLGGFSLLGIALHQWLAWRRTLGPGQ